MWSGNGGWTGRNGTWSYEAAQPGWSSHERQPVPETFAELRERDVNTTWREYYHTESDAKYYHNIITNKSQWEHPGVAVKKQPPPPSSPPPPKPVKGNDGPEHKQWRKITNDPARGKYWYNTVTEKIQIDRPACCTKYKKYLS